MRLWILLATAVVTLAAQPSHEGPPCHDYPVRKAGRVENPNCHCELVAVTKPDGTKTCEVRHYAEGMPARCAHDCKESELCACHPDEGCTPPSMHR